MYKAPNQGYQLHEDMDVHNLEWNPDKRIMQNKINVNSMEHDPTEELASLRVNQKVLEQKIETLTSSLHAMQVDCGNYKGPYLTKDCSQNQPMMTLKKVSYMQQGLRGNFQGGNQNWGNNRNFNPRQNPPGFYPHNQQTIQGPSKPTKNLSHHWRH